MIEAPFTGTGPLTLTRIRLDNGLAFPGESGGALRSTGSKSVILNDSRVTNSDTDSRGGGMLVTGDLTLNDSTVSGNESTDTGGNVGAGIVSNGDVIIDHSTITANNVVSPDDAVSDDTFGGGIAASIGSLTIIDSTVSDNTVSTADSSDNAGGAGIYAEDIPVTIRRSAITGNVVLGVPFGRLGGGIFFNDTDPADPALSIENSTFASNLGGSSGFIFGGGILVHGGVTEVAYTTFNANNAGDGDAVNYDDFADAGSSATFLGTIFDDGTGTDECGGPDAVGSAGFNLDKGISCGLGAGGDQSSIDTLITGVGDNGGPTQTADLPGASPALDVIPPASCLGIDAAPLAVDQRGFERPFGAGCDAGAYERVLCDGVAADETDLVGTAGADTITGTAGDDDILGFGGDDVIDGLGGNDDICGGGGTDTASFASGGAVSATMAGASGQGADELESFENLTGSAFADDLLGDDLVNALDGGGGDDVLNGSEGDDELDGGGGTDTASFAFGAAVTASTTAATGQGSDQLDSVESLGGSDFADQLTGDALANLLAGGGGDDTVNGRGAMTRWTAAGAPTRPPSRAGAAVIAIDDDGDGPGVRPARLRGEPHRLWHSPTGSPETPLANLLAGGGGDDTVNGGGGNDSLNGGGGIDTASFSGGAAVNASLGTNTATGQGTDAMSGLENLAGSSFADVLLGNALANLIRGGNGADLIRGKGGNDSVFGDAGKDKLFGDGGNDKLNGGGGKPDRCNGGAGKDRRKATGCERKKKIP